MNRETAMAGGAIGLLALVVLAMVVVPGVMATPEENVRPSVLQLRSDAPPAVTAVDGDSVTLQVDTRVVHRGGASRNVTLELRAIDAETGLLADRQLRDVGSLTEEREERVLTNLSLAREGGYRIETILYEDGERVASGSREISGVGSLTPAYARSPIEFQRFSDQGADLPTITYSIDEVADEEATLSVSAALTNTGSEAAGDVDLVLRARQAESNVIADRTTIDVEDIQPGRTVTPSAQLTVPDGYNYWLDAMIVSDGVIVGTAVEPANLDPQETLERNQTRRDVGFESGDFTGGEDAGSVDDEPYRSPQPAEEAGPGFGVALTLLAVVAAGLIAARRHTP